MTQIPFQVTIPCEYMKIFLKNFLFQTPQKYCLLGEIPVKGKGNMKTFELSLDGPFPTKKKYSKEPTKIDPVMRKGLTSLFYRGSISSRRGGISAKSIKRRSRSSSAKDSRRPSKPKVSFNSNLPKRKTKSIGSKTRSPKVS